VSYFAVANVAHHCINHNYFIPFFTFILRFLLNHLTIKPLATNKNTLNRILKSKFEFA
jgi:hypothetical protein